MSVSIELVNHVEKDQSTSIYLLSNEFDFHTNQ